MNHPAIYHRDEVIERLGLGHLKHAAQATWLSRLAAYGARRVSRICWDAGSVEKAIPRLLDMMALERDRREARSNRKVG